MSFGDGFCVNRKGGTGGGGWGQLKGANSMAVFRLSIGYTLVGTGWATSLLLFTNRLKKKVFHLIGPTFPAIKLLP